MEVKLRQFMVFALLVFPSAVFSQSGEGEDKVTLQLQEMVRTEQEFLESAFEIEFSENVPAFFDLPPGVTAGEARGKEAWYVPESGSILIKPVYRDMIGDANTRRFLISAIRHELGHAFAHQTSLRLGGGRWPPRPKVLPEFLAEGSDGVIGSTVLSEGIGRVFERVGATERINCELDNYLPGENVYIPRKKDDMSWKIHHMFDAMVYEGGYCLALPIILEYGKRGIEYMVMHALVFPDWNLRSAMQSYTHEALNSLAGS